jgi:formamidopyrimidine-DNA glycosylase
MPELPELEVMREVLEVRVVGRVIREARPYRPAILKTAEPSLGALAGESFRSVARRGKHLILTCRDDLCLVVHLMVAGRLVLTGSANKVTKATGFVISFADGEDLRLVENGTAKLARVHVVRDPEDVEWVARGGMEPLGNDFAVADLSRLFAGERRQLKKMITDQALLVGIGTAYADEILFAARLSPIRYANTLETGEVERLHAAIRSVLGAAVERTRRESGGALVGERRVEGMAVYKRTGEACIACRAPIAEIRFAETRTFYCPQCQSKGQTIADRRAWLRR